MLPLTALAPASPVRDDYAAAVTALLGAVIGIVAIVLMGWTFHVEPMKRIVTGLTSMNPMTATCFVAAAFALWQQRLAPAQGRRALAVTAAALFMIYVGASKIVDLATGSHFCPDDLLFASQLNFGQAYPSRMAPNVAASFVLLGVSILLTLRAKAPRFHPQWLVLPILCAALIALVGYAYDTTGFYKYRQYIPMALHTAVCFLLASSAFILSRPDEGFIRLIPRKSPGARTFARMLPACVLIPAVLGGLELYGSDQGWFSGAGTGAAVVSVLTILALSVMAFLISAAVARTAAVQAQAEGELRQLVSALDSSNKALQLEVAERKRQEARARHEATHDALTGLANRLLFVDRLQNSVSRTVRHSNSCALFYIDVDHFKPVNDRYGHHAGDLVLKMLADRLRQAVREVDTVARLGGDEFAVIMDSPSDVAEAMALADRLAKTVTAPFVLELPGHLEPVAIHIGVSVGIAVFPGHASDLDSLVRVADTAMYRAKVGGRSQGRLTSIEVGKAA